MTVSKLLKVAEECMVAAPQQTSASGINSPAGRTQKVLLQRSPFYELEEWMQPSRTFGS